MKHIICVALFLMYSNSLNAQTLFRAMQSFVVPITYKVAGLPKQSIGTGSIFYKVMDSNSAKIFLITNRHVLPKPTEATFVNVKISETEARRNTYKEVSISLYDNSGKELPGVHINKNEDLAIIDITNVFNEHDMQYLYAFLLPFDNFASREKIAKSEIYPGREIYFAGYPSWHYNAKNATPIIRKGIIATSIKDNYFFSDETFKEKKLNGFLIDASAFGGSSGSLVFNNSTYSEPYISFKMGGVGINSMGEVSLVLGILTESYFDNDSKNQRINLGGVISSAAIVDFFNSLGY